MELPQKLTTDLKIVQHQMKLEIQTHQIMRIKQAKDPNNYKLHDDLREIEKRISSLGEKQNQLMRWLRKLITSIPSNSALMAKTIATALGISVNGTHPYSGFNPNNLSPINSCISISKKNNANSPTKDQIQSNGLPTTPVNLKNETDELSDEVSIKVESKEKFHERETKSVYKNVPEIYSSQGKTSKNQVSQNANDMCQKQISTENKDSSLEPLTAEKEKFLSAIGLVTREILKDLQNRRVERKRRSTANHTQFVYGSNWDISSKKRKKSNYLTSSGKQQVTRQGTKVQSPRTETPTISSKLNPTVSIFKTPLPISNQNQNCSSDNIVNNSISSQKAVVKSVPVVSSVDNEPDSVSSSDITTSVVIYKCKEGGSCFVCQKPDSNTFACACSINYHQSCAEIVENCVGCGGQLIKGNITERRAEKHRLQEMNNRLNNEKQELETRAAELSVTLATQSERKKKLLSLEEDVRRKIQHIHEFVAIMKNSHSVPSS
ncbi:Uncharacterized protein GBIM_06596 [Gryllus bimaculatus]|nr:Uncharacterized protein GBIM_06596 [Gryllus bimaculatus]